MRGFLRCARRGASRIATVAGLALCPSSVPASVTAQVTASERSTLTQKVSGTELVLDYSRPSARGRDPLFGELVPWGEVWAPGANNATTLRLSKDVTMNGQEVPAGKYSVWLQPNEIDPWVLMLHSDTTLFHVPHPSLDEAFMTIPVEVERVDDFTETMRWDIDGVRADGAELRFTWGTTRMHVDVGIDPGFVLTVEAAEAQRYVGEWTIARSMSAPTDSAVADWKKDASDEQVAQIDEYVASLSVPKSITISFEPEGERLVIYDRAMAESWGQSGEEPMLLLMPKAEGIFTAGTLMYGELAFASDQGYWEFDFGDHGEAVSMTQRGRDDRVMARGERTGT